MATTGRGGIKPTRNATTTRRGHDQYHHHHHHRNPSQTVGRVHSVAVSAMQDDEVEGHFEPFYEVRLKYAVSLCECVVKKA